MGVVLRVFGQQGLVAESPGFRIKDHLRTECTAMFMKNGAFSPVVIELIPAEHVSDSHQR